LETTQDSTFKTSRYQTWKIVQTPPS